MTEPLHALSIRRLHTAYAAGETTPSAVTTHYLDRIARHDPALRAYIAVNGDGARSDAAESDRRIAVGEARALEGVPVAIKANIAVAGMEWNAGMAARRGIVADTDADAVARLRAAGAVILGTLNMHEAALGATTDNPWFGRAINPHRDGHTPGGSSGGSGAAVAAGLCVAALGTDTLGSVRIPAAYNGVYGIKPSHGAVSDGGLAPLSVALDSIGPLARSLDDLDILLPVLMNVIEAPAPVRLLTLDAIGGMACEPAVRAAYDRALTTLDTLTPAPLAFDDTPDAIRFAAFVVAARELSGHLGTLRQSEELSNELRFLLGVAEGQSQGAVTDAEATLARTARRLREAIGADGVLLMPTTPQAAFAHSARPPVNQPDFTALANIAGLPAISIPAGRDENGLPVGVQLVGAIGSEAALLTLAHTLDQSLRGYAPPVLP